MSKACIACPFRDGESIEATQAQNWGCLPSSHEMIETAKTTDVALSCHDNEKIACRGLVEHMPEAANMAVKAHEDWYRNG